MKLKSLGYAAVAATMTIAFALASASPSEAAKKTKKMAAKPAAQSMSCMMLPEAKVCGTRGGMKFTYANACYAAKDGAKVVSQKACPAPKATKAKKGGKKMAKKPSKTPSKKKMK